MASAATTVPYCGVPPVPAELWRNWNLDPVLIAALLLIAGAYGLGMRRLQVAGRPGPGTGEQAAFYAGWGILSLALISPLCSLSVALFAARVGQHMILTLIAAPLIVLGRPFLVLSELFPAYAAAFQQGRSPASAAAARPLASAPAAFGLFTLLLWFWHAPGPYAATFASSAVYWTMHLSLIGSALLLWRVLLDVSPAGALRGLGYGFASSMQMSFLGALLTFSVRPFYAPHLTTTWPWGLSPLDDQQLGGLIMWVPGCTVFVAVGLLCAGIWLARLGASEPLIAVRPRPSA